MATRHQLTRNGLKGEIAFFREVYEQMDIEAIELILDTFISVLILGIAVSYSSNLDIAIMAVTVIQGLKLPRLVQAYYSVKAEQAKQRRFDT